VTVAWEPGLDVHEWESEWASLEDDIADSPETALPIVHELITRMLRERDILDENLVVAEGADPEWFRTWEAGKELVVLVDGADGDVDRQDLLDQLEEYRSLFEALIEERPAP
jgi:hypothetical protein